MKISIVILVMLLTVLSVKAQPPKDFMTVFNELNIECDIKHDPIQNAVLKNYGAVFVSKKAVFAGNCLFKNKGAVDSFFKDVIKNDKNKLNFADFYLQFEAKQSLERVFEKLGYLNVARNCNGTVTCTKGINDDWAFRIYEQAEDNWNNNLTENGLAGKSVKEIVMKYPFYLQSYAIPGGSQHHLGLAIDVNNGTGNSDDPECKKKKRVCRKCDEDNCVKVLNENGWYRTVLNDPYHFTYLGYLKRGELLKNGLKEVKDKSKHIYWMPNI